MKKIWSYLAMLFAGFAVGLIAMYKIIGDTVEVNIKRIKTKKGSSDIDIPINIDSRRERRKSTKKST